MLLTIMFVWMMVFGNHVVHGAISQEPRELESLGGSSVRLRRATNVTQPKCKEVIQGAYYLGDYGAPIENVNTSQQCLNLCEKDTTCLGWSYYTTDKMCWLQRTVTAKLSSTGYVSGSCYGPQVKATCTEVLQGAYYYGTYGSKISNVPNYQNCSRLCDRNTTCLGWSYSATDKACWLQPDIFQPITDSRYIGGSCLVAVPPITWDQFRQQSLDMHNYYRKKHCVPALNLSCELSYIAQKYAEVLAANNTMVHSHGSFHGEGMGENLFWSSVAYNDTNFHGSRAVTAWYQEIKSYNFSNPGFSSATGHFTQVVWKNTQQLGTGIAFTKDLKGVYIVANYYPAGNVIGSFPANVPKLC